MGEKELLVIREKVFLENIAVSSPRPLDDPRGHHHDVGFRCIRFLESQGLLDPERTPSGYRKFYEPDIERLRWILRQQRENFLPLRVIKDRLQNKQAAPPEPRPSSPPAPAPAPIRTSEPPPVAPPAAPAAAPPPRAPLSEEPPPRGPSALDTGPSAVSLTRDASASRPGTCACTR